ncbi:spore maturation protein [Tumebacillus permanentifrigoris]|uniref:Spore maturation protein B n=1 Tax=Tumebacillus permanentifrigoris TaxID=378543 RepID=A0A316DC05_9BACL|nr:spore maturation protein [Tumebacillus permanentifrigoris]PWK14436.1 spore maturation protein B [Tumebacillus permanentifrigoris]
MMQVAQWFAAWSLPLIIAFIPVYAYLIKKVPVYDTFIDGAKDGFSTVLALLPHLVGMLVAVTVFRESGAMELLVNALNPLLQPLGVPPEFLPMALLRSISGSGSMAVMTDIFQTHGPDSFLGRLASTMQGASDTTLYVLTVYFGSVGIRKARYAVKVGLLADLASVIAALFVTHWFFG